MPEPLDVLKVFGKKRRFGFPQPDSADLFLALASRVINSWIPNLEIFIDLE